MFARRPKVFLLPINIDLVGRVDVRAKLFADIVVQITDVPVLLRQGKSIGLNAGLPLIQRCRQTLEQDECHFASLELMVPPPRMPTYLRTRMGVLFLNGSQVRPWLPAYGIVLLSPSVEVLSGPWQFLGFFGIFGSRRYHGCVGQEIAHHGRSVSLRRNIKMELIQNDGNTFTTQYGLLVPQIHSIALLGHGGIPFHNVGLAIQILATNAELESTDPTLTHVAGHQPNAQLVHDGFHQVMECNNSVLLELIAMSGRGGMSTQHSVPFVVGNQSMQKLADETIKCRTTQRGNAIGMVGVAVISLPNNLGSPLLGPLGLLFVGQRRSIGLLQRRAVFSIDALLDPIDQCPGFLDKFFHIRFVLLPTTVGHVVIWQILVIDLIKIGDRSIGLGIHKAPRTPLLSHLVHFFDIFRLLRIQFFLGLVVQVTGIGTSVFVMHVMAQQIHNIFRIQTSRGLTKVGHGDDDVLKCHPLALGGGLGPTGMADVVLSSKGGGVRCRSVSRRFIDLARSELRMDHLEGDVCVVHKQKCEGGKAGNEDEIADGEC